MMAQGTRGDEARKLGGRDLDLDWRNVRREVRLRGSFRQLFLQAWPGGGKGVLYLVWNARFVDGI